MKVLGDRVLVALRPEPDEITRDSGLVLARDPDIIRTPTQGIVVQVGEKARTVDLDDVLYELGKVRTNGRLDGACCVNTIETLIDTFTAMKSPAFDVHVGECVLFPRFVGEEFEEAGITYVVLKEAEIIGVVEPRSEDA